MLSRVVPVKEPKPKLTAGGRQRGSRLAAEEVAWAKPLPLTTSGDTYVAARAAAQSRVAGP